MKVSWEQVLDELVGLGAEYEGLETYRLSKDVVDFLIDVAHVTDNREMGGILGGEVVGDEGFTLWQLYDVVPCPNTSSHSEGQYVTERSCFDEAWERYDALAPYHTHPDDSFFSRVDLADLYDAFYEAKKDEAVPVEFLITGGNLHYIAAIAYFPFAILFIMPDGIKTYKKSTLISERHYEYYEFYIREYPKNFVSQLQMVVLSVKRKPKFIAPPIKRVVFTKRF